MEIIYVNCGLRNEDVSDHRSYEHYLRVGLEIRRYPLRSHKT